MTLGIVQQLREAAGTLHSYSARRGLRATLLAVARTLLQPLVRFRHHFIWEALLDAPRAPSAWSHHEQLSIIGPETIDQEMNPRLRRFLGDTAAAGDLQGVKAGDRLLLVTLAGSYAYSGYLYFDTTSDTRRQKKIYHEPANTPVIGTCASIWHGPADQLPSETLERLLPPGSHMPNPAAGFKNLGQFVYAAQLAHQLDIPFAGLKARVAAGENLGQAVQALKPGVDAAGEVRRVCDEASLHRRAINDGFRYLQQLGYKRAVMDVLAQNRASNMASEAVGMKLCRELRDWTILRHLVVQRVTEASRSRWRLFVI